MKLIEQDILTVKDGIILHQVNVHGVMGGGIAYHIAQKWPHVCKDYEDFCKTVKDVFGKVLFSKAEDGNPLELFVANCFSQMQKEINGTLTDYDAVRKCFETVYPLARYQSIHIPYQYGCGIAGGDWPTVVKIIEETLPMATIYILPSLAEKMRMEGKEIIH